MLAPPAGTPGPTMKTLDQVEARIIVNATNTPGDATNAFKITTSGSYYLTGNIIISLTGMNGIQIAADDVSLDLNGFAIVGLGGLTNGITVLGTRHNLRIHNGIIKNWPGYGIEANKDSGNYAEQSEFDRLRLYSNGIAGIHCRGYDTFTEVRADSCGNGIQTGQGCRLFACSATNSGGAGFNLGKSNVITASDATFNGGVGIQTSDGCTIVDCAAGSNQGAGISVGISCLVKNCGASLNSGAGIVTAVTAHGSSIVDCVAGVNGTATNAGGISVADHMTVVRCTAEKNKGPGIAVTGDSLVQENQCSGNTGDGIKATGSINRIDGNHTNYNSGYGINAGSDWVVRNTSSNNFAGQFNPLSGPDIGPIQTASTATNPFANLQ